MLFPAMDKTTTSKCLSQHLNATLWTKQVELNNKPTLYTKEYVILRKYNEVNNGSFINQIIEQLA